MKISIEDLKMKKYTEGWDYLKIMETEILQEDEVRRVEIKNNGKQVTYSKGKGGLPATLNRKWEETLWSRALMIHRKGGLDGYDEKDRPCKLKLPLTVILVRCSTIHYGNKPDNEDIIAIIDKDGLMKYVDEIEKIIEDNDNLKKQIEHQIECCESKDVKTFFDPYGKKQINLDLKTQSEPMRINPGKSWTEKKIKDEKSKPNANQEYILKLEKELEFYQKRINLLKNYPISVE